MEKKINWYETLHTVKVLRLGQLPPTNPTKLISKAYYLEGFSSI